MVFVVNSVPIDYIHCKNVMVTLTVYMVISVAHMLNIWH